MNKISHVMRNLICSSADSSCFVLAAELSGVWEEIVGSELCHVCAIKSIQYIGKNTIMIYINIIASAALIAQYKSDDIKEQIRRHSKMNNIQLVFKHCSHIYIAVDENVSANRVSNDKERCFVAEDFENQKLKSALENFKTELQYEI